MMMRNVYLADDDCDDVELFQVALEEICGTCNFTSSKDGVDLLRKLSDASDSLPEVLFIDVNMPMMNGLDCLAKIRSQDNLKNIPVVILTTSATLFTIEKAFKLGANLFVEKPSHFDDLKSMIDKVVHLDWTNRPNGNMSQFIYKAS